MRPQMNSNSFEPTKPAKIPPRIERGANRIRLIEIPVTQARPVSNSGFVHPQRKQGQVVSRPPRDKVHHLVLELAQHLVGLEGAEGRQELLEPAVAEDLAVPPRFGDP